MNAKHVPERREGMDVPSREKQLRFLLERLAGHQAFGRLRGRMGGCYEGGGEDNLSFAMDLGKMLKDAGSPTDFCRRLDEQFADVRVVGNLLAQLRRDCWTAAETELRRALTDDSYFMEGEAMPVEKLEPVTLLILDFPRTLAMLKWIVAGHWFHKNNALDGLRPEYGLAEMFRQFPTLHERAVKRGTGYAYGDVLSAAAFSSLLGESEGRCLTIYDLLHAYDDTVGGLHLKVYEKFQEVAMAPLRLKWVMYHDFLVAEAVDRVFGFLVRAEQGEVLRRFTREEQGSVSTWQCRPPKLWMEDFFREPSGIEHFDIGFHPEGEHESWKNRTDAFASAGVSRGYGAVLLNSRLFGGSGYCTVLDGALKGEPFRFMLERK